VGMKIKAKDGMLSRVPGGLPKQLIKDLNNGKMVEVDVIPHKLLSLVEEVKEVKKTKESK
tara:strand:+ start:2012 stop:2191 length:180 start_codon:yes stop_codon:yes gene_type:complete